MFQHPQFQINEKSINAGPEQKCSALKHRPASRHYERCPTYYVTEAPAHVTC